MGVLVVLAAVLARPAAGGALAHAAAEFWAFLDFFVGVFTLLALTATVVCGLVATDRMVLTPRLRISTQLVHRGTAVAALVFLVTHIFVKVAEGHTGLMATVVPFSDGSPVAVGMGVVSADLMVLAAVTGVVRGRFAGSRRPWLWRALHGTAYACWGFALVHGLTAGRPAKTWVLWSYGVCAAAVALMLTVRALDLLGRRYGARRARPTLLAYEPAATRHEELSGLSELSFAGTRGAAQPARNGRPAAPAPQPPQVPVGITSMQPPQRAGAARTATAARVVPQQAPPAPAPAVSAYHLPEWDTSVPAQQPVYDTSGHGFPVYDTAAGGLPVYGGALYGFSAYDTSPHGIPAYDGTPPHGVPFQPAAPQPHTVPSAPGPHAGQYGAGAHSAVPSVSGRPGGRAFGPDGTGQFAPGAYPYPYDTGQIPAVGPHWFPDGRGTAR